VVVLELLEALAVRAAQAAAATDRRLVVRQESQILVAVEAQVDQIVVLVILAVLVDLVSLLLDIGLHDGSFCTTRRK
jgi:hypothetical protein